MPNVDLNDMKDKLVTAFNKCIQGSNWNYESDAAYLNAAANIAQAIVVIEREQREAHEQEHGRAMSGKP
jgi:hypothetical protein